MRLFTNGQTIAFEETGRGEPTIVFSHGFLLHGGMWAAACGALQDRHRCLVWDQRGFGATGPTDRAFSYWDSARDLLALMDERGIESACLVGLSQGGFLAMRAALLAPQRVRGLVLISTQAGVDDASTAAGFGELRQEWASNGSTNVEDHLAGLLLGGVPEPRPWIEHWRRVPRNALALPIDALVGRDDLTPRLGDIRCPALVIHGDADGAIDMARGRALADLLGGPTTFCTISGAGHAPPLSHPTQTTELVERFVDALP